MVKGYVPADVSKYLTQRRNELAYAKEQLSYRSVKSLGNVSTKPNDIAFPYVEALFGPQKEFVLDPHKNKTGKTGRRSGKTTGAGSYLTMEAEKWDKCEVLYVALTRMVAQELLWPKLQYINDTFHLGMRFNHSKLTATTRNGSIIYVRGAHDRKEIEKLRGHAYKLVIIDESQSFGAHLDYLIDEILDPALLDGDGTMALLGTPNAACVGRFHDISNGVIRGWSNHEWTVMDNPFMPHADAWIKRKAMERGLSLDHPVIQREYFGRWVKSMEYVVYRYREDKNVITELPDMRRMTLGMGIDLGYHDATAITIGGWSDYDDNFYVIDGFKRVGMLPYQVAKVVKHFQSKYELAWIRADTGGLGKMIVEEMRQRYGLPIEAADKKNKHDFIEICNSDFDTGRIKIYKENEELKQLCAQLSVLQWDEKRKKEDGRFANDMCDAFLYNYREGKQYAEEPEVIEPEYDSPEYIDREEQRQIDEYESGLRAEDNDFLSKYE